MKWGILLAAWIIPKFNLAQYVWSVALGSGGTLTEGGFLLFGLGRWMKTLQHPFSFCGSELVIFKVYLFIGRLVRSVSIALKISLKSHNSLHLELLCPLKCYQVMWTLLTSHSFWRLLTPVTCTFWRLTIAIHFFLRSWSLGKPYMWEPFSDRLEHPNAAQPTMVWPLI